MSFEAMDYLFLYKKKTGVIYFSATSFVVQLKLQLFSRCGHSLSSARAWGT